MCCQITVPANVNCIQIDMWAAGGNSWGANCCGGSHFGHTGGFVSIVMPTCSGWNYTLCAGCAYCCYPSHSGGAQNGCQSYVTGTGLTNFCAEGGQGDGKVMNKEHNHCTSYAQFFIIFTNKLI